MAIPDTVTDKCNPAVLQRARRDRIFTLLVLGQVKDDAARSNDLIVKINATLPPKAGAEVSTATSRKQETSLKGVLLGLIAEIDLTKIIITLIGALGTMGVAWIKRWPPDSDGPVA